VLTSSVDADPMILRPGSSGSDGGGVGEGSRSEVVARDRMGGGTSGGLGLARREAGGGSWGERIRPLVWQLTRTWRRLAPSTTGGNDELASGHT
jgi:hypothetical protein